MLRSELPEGTQVVVGLHGGPYELHGGNAVTVDANGDALWMLRFEWNHASPAHFPTDEELRPGGNRGHTLFLRAYATTDYKTRIAKTAVWVPCNHGRAVTSRAPPRHRPFKRALEQLGSCFAIVAGRDPHAVLGWDDDTGKWSVVKNDGDNTPTAGHVIEAQAKLLLHAARLPCGVSNPLVHPALAAALRVPEHVKPY